MTNKIVHILDSIKTATVTAQNASRYAQASAKEARLYALILIAYMVIFTIVLGVVLCIGIMLYAVPPALVVVLASLAAIVLILAIRISIFAHRTAVHSLHAHIAVTSATDTADQAATLAEYFKQAYMSALEAARIATNTMINSDSYTDVSALAINHYVEAPPPANVVIIDKYKCAAAHTAYATAIKDLHELEQAYNPVYFHKYKYADWNAKQLFY